MSTMAASQSDEGSRSPMSINMDQGAEAVMEQDDQGRHGVWLDVHFPQYQLVIPNGGVIEVNGQRIPCPPQTAFVRGVPMKTWVPQAQLTQNGVIYVQPQLTYAKIQAADGTYFKARAKNEKFRFKPPTVKPFGGKVAPSRSSSLDLRPPNVSETAGSSSRSLPSAATQTSGSRSTPTSSGNSGSGSRSSKTPGISSSGSASGGTSGTGTTASGSGAQSSPGSSQQHGFEDNEVGVVSPVVRLQIRQPGQSLEDVKTYRFGSGQ